MRIVAGSLKGRRLETPKDSAVTRPTSDKVRQAIFNMLHARGAVSDARVIDAFCGTGALGLEALSQGAAHVLFIDKNKGSLGLAERNVQMCAVRDQCDFLCRDSTKIQPKPEGVPPFDLVFLDPPYRQGLIARVVQALEDQGWLTPSCTLVCEMAKDEPVDLLGWECVQDKVYGDTRVVLYKTPA